MATVTFVKNTKQTSNAMKGVLNYCCRKDKTLFDENIRLLTGVNCTASSAYREFMLTKESFWKANGRFFYQYVQSFSPKENITPQQAHAAGVELAEQWPGHEVLVATHLDGNQLHNHFVINSVGFESGLKLRQDKETLKRLRKASDEICVRHGFSVLKPYEKSEKKGMSAREYRAADKRKSWKFRLMGAVNHAMNRSRTREDFIRNMNAMGYSVRWEDSRQNITYTCPNKMKCRDNRLHDQKYLKEHMQNEFTIRTTQNEFGRPRGKKRGRLVRDGRAAETRYGGDSGETLGRDGFFAEASRDLSAEPAKSAQPISKARGAGEYTGRTEGRGGFRDAESGENRSGSMQDSNDQERKYRAVDPESTVTGWEESRAIFQRYAGGVHTDVEQADDQKLENMVWDQDSGTDIVSVAVGAGVMVVAAMSESDKPVNDSTRKRYSVSSASTKRKKQAQGIRESDDEEQDEGPVMSML